ncbi:peptidase A4 family-domain-containing protein [Xylariales sp. PMI_506]|nr:peptidase A4 family-domain-containing protein [Xylariales sp. PMI_506]
MRAFGLIFGLISLASANSIYEYTLKDASGADIPFETFQLPNVTSYRPDSLSKRVEINSGWCGAAQVEPPSGNFTSVTGTWTVPVVTPPTDGTGIDDPYYLYQWVGIDGYYWNSSCDALIQAGTGFILYEDTIYSLFVWTEYYPASVVGVNMSVSEGDVFKVTVNTTSTTTGVIVIENQTIGQTLTATIDGTGVGTLCGITAEWINENPDDGAEPYPQFSTFDIKDCSAETSTGAVEGLTGASLMYGGDSLTTVRCLASIISDSDLQFTYTP